MSGAIVPIERIESRILLVRGHKVMLDADLAELFGVTTGRLNEAVKRNAGRFPSDFMFPLTPKEYQCLISQIAISKGRGGRRKAPSVFTEHGAVMAANVLNSQRAIAASVWVVRAFIKLRETLATHKELASKFAELERRLDTHDEEIGTLMATLHELMNPPEEPAKGRMGFHPNGIPVSQVGSRIELRGVPTQRQTGKARKKLGKSKA